MDDRYNTAWAEVEAGLARLGRSYGFGSVKRAAHLLADALEELASAAAWLQDEEARKDAQ